MERASVDQSLSLLFRGISAIIAMTVLSPTTSAQIVEGVVRRDDGSGVVVEGVAIELINPADSVVARATSDASGRFIIRIVSPGQYRLRGNRLGYTDFASGLFALGLGQNVDAEVLLVVDPLALDPLEVLGEGEDPRLRRAGFYRRLAAGAGQFLTREDIEELHARRTTDLLRRLPGVDVVRDGPTRADVIMRGGRTTFVRGGTCYPSISIDGLVVRSGGTGEVGTWSQLFHPDEIEAVEVYSGRAGLPPQVAGPISPCGALLFWTRR